MGHLTLERLDRSLYVITLNGDLVVVPSRSGSKLASLFFGFTDVISRLKVAEGYGSILHLSSLRFALFEIYQNIQSVRPNAVKQDQLPVIQAHPKDDRFGRDRKALRLPIPEEAAGKGRSARPQIPAAAKWTGHGL